MLQNYFLIAIRNLNKSRIFSIINIAGLTIGISACLMSALYLQNELTFDQFHRDHERIYRVAFDNYNQEGPHATTPFPVGPAIQQEFSDVEALTRVGSFDNYLIRFEGNAFFEKLTLVDSSFFSVFSFNLLKGNPATALTGPNQIVISEDIAKKYFGDSDPIGKMLTIGSSGSLNSIITGVVQSPPGNSQLQFDFLISLSTFEKVGMQTSIWFQMPPNFTFIKLQKNSSPAQLTSLFPGFVKKYLGDKLTSSYESGYNLVLQPLADIHLTSHRKGEPSTQGSETTIYLFITVSAMILLIACINYTNLTTARYIKRAREIGVRKVAGASRLQLVGQLLSESILLSIMAGLIAILVTDLTLPIFNQLSGGEIQISQLANPLLLSIWALLVLVPAIGAGLLPALFLSRINIIQSLKSSLTFSFKGLLLRKALVTFQFFSAIVLLVCTLVVFRQMDFIRSTLYHHDKSEQVLVFPMNAKLAKSFGVLRNQLEGESKIIEVAASSSVPSFNYDSWGVKTSVDGDDIRTENYVVDESYLNVMGYTLVAGRNFDKKLQSDSSSFIINEKAVRDYGFGTPENALDKPLIWGEGKKGTVIGVVKDFNFSTFREEIIPALFQKDNAENWHRFVAIRVLTDDFATTLEHIRKSVASLDENWIVDYHFLDENFEKLHQRDLIQGKLFGVFAGIAILISCMGLLGLVIFSTTQRNKEMGIRKTLGASSQGLVYLILKDFLILFLVAYIISFPVSYYLIDQWLNGFAYRIPLSADVFLLTGGLVLVSVFITIGYQTLKTASVSPTDVLRSE